MYDIKDKVVLITGASSGIGKATAIYFSKDGAKVIVNYNKNETGAKETLAQVIDGGGDGIMIQADISKCNQVDSMFEEILKKYETIDVLINNAGILGPYGDFDSLNIQEIEKLFQTNLIGPMYCAQKFIQICKQQHKKGVILNNSSVYGNHERGGDGSLVPYHASKGGLTNFTGILAKAVSPDIRVNGVAPAVVLTPIQEGYSQEIKDSFSKRTLIKRWIQPEEVAHAFLFLAQNEAITGQIIYIDGGFMMNG